MTLMASGIVIQTGLSKLVCLRLLSESCLWRIISTDRNDADTRSNRAAAIVSSEAQEDNGSRKQSHCLPHEVFGACLHCKVSHV